MTERAEGFYWVKRKGKWFPALCDFCDDIGLVYTTIDFSGLPEDFDAIGPRLTPPDAHNNTHGEA